MTTDARQRFGLSGRLALVTGASSGLGARIAATLDAAGAEVVLTGRDTERLQTVARGLGDTPRSFRATSPTPRSGGRWSTRSRPGTVASTCW